MPQGGRMVAVPPKTIAGAGYHAFIERMSEEQAKECLKAIVSGVEDGPKRVGLQYLDDLLRLMVS